jgi:hypothetical protein
LIILIILDPTVRLSAKDLPDDGRVPLLCRQHREAILSKVSVKGEGRGNTNPLHHRKARGIGEEKVFVRILVDNRLGTLHLTRCYPYQSCRAVFHVQKKSGGNRLA